MYYPETQSKEPELKSAGKYLFVVCILLAALFFFWSWPVVGLPMEVAALVLCIVSLESLQRRWSVALLVVDSIFIALTLINIGVRIYLAYL